LSPKIPLDLAIDAASGAENLDLRGLQLNSLKIDAASGATQLSLPDSAKPYQVSYDGASGAAEIDLPAQTGLTLTLNGASGAINVRLPAGSPARVEVNDSGSGWMNIDPRLQRMSGSGSDQEGAWETPDYNQAAHQILIRVNGVGSGSIQIH
jgi:hypothetical protein